MTRAIYIEDIKRAERQAMLRAKMEPRHADLLGSTMEAPASIEGRENGGGEVVRIR